MGVWWGKGYSPSLLGRVWVGAVLITGKILGAQPQKWCILVHFCTNLGFHVQGLNIEVRGQTPPANLPLPGYLPPFKNCNPALGISALRLCLVAYFLIV